MGLWRSPPSPLPPPPNNSAGKSLSNLTGWFGRAWDQGYVQHFHTLGYPVNSTANTALPNAGKYLRSCQAESFMQTTNVVGLGCDLGPGHSGGAFIVGYKLNEVSGQVRSVYSGFFVGQNNAFGASSGATSCRCPRLPPAVPPNRYPL